MTTSALHHSNQSLLLQQHTAGCAWQFDDCQDSSLMGFVCNLLEASTDDQSRLQCLLQSGCNIGNHVAARCTAGI